MNHIKQEQGSLWIVGSLTRENVKAVRQELLTALSTQEPSVTVRLVDVSCVDSAGIQLLSALVKAYPCVRLSGASNVVRAALERLGALGLVGSTA